jgi:hypothetical protein
VGAERLLLPGLLLNSQLIGPRLHLGRLGGLQAGDDAGPDDAEEESEPPSQAGTAFPLTDGLRAEGESQGDDEPD